VLTVLVISRKQGESFLVGSDVEISVLEVRGDSVKIGIDAPRSLPVWRKEIFAEIAEENRRAVSQRAGADAEALLKRLGTGRGADRDRDSLEEKPR